MKSSVLRFLCTVIKENSKINYFIQELKLAKLFILYEKFTETYWKTNINVVRDYKVNNCVYYHIWIELM